MNKFSFMKIIETPVIDGVRLQKENKILQEARTTVAYVFNNKKLANIFAKDVEKYVKSVEQVDGKKKNTFKVRLKLDQDDSGKNKDTMKVLNLAQKNNGKIDVRENRVLESMTKTIFTPPKSRGINDWNDDTIDAINKADSTKSEDEENGEEEIELSDNDENWEEEENAADYEDWSSGAPENNSEENESPEVEPEEKSDEDDEN